MITLRIPLPPSVNALFANVPGKGRVKTDRYKTWLNAVGWDVVQQRQSPIKGDVTLEIVAGRPDRRRRDLSNLIKAAEDLLVRHGLIEDDSRVTSLSIAWTAIEGCQVTVREVA